MRSAPGALGLLVLGLSAPVAHAQDLVPGAYTPAPVGFTIVTVTGSFSDGDLSFDPSVPVERGRARIGAMGAGFNRTLNLAGRFASVGVGMPYVRGHVEGLVRGQPQEASRSGLGDMAARIAVNLYGAPAMTLKEFAAHRVSNFLGVSFVTGLPLGQYEPARFVNIGTNRWYFKPEVGMAHRRGRWTFEGDFGATFFTDNAEYAGGPQEQSPIASVQAHVIYAFRPNLWVAGDANYWNGGRISTAGIENLRKQENSRVGITLAVPVSRQQVRIAYSLGALTTIGGDFHSVGVSYSYVWAARP